MKKLIQICDRCGSRECPYESVYATVGRDMDDAGSDDSEMLARVEDVDLCPLCMRAVMQGMVEKMDYDSAEEWVAMARTMNKPVR